MPVKLPYGLREGRLVDIRGVERGLACGCVCPACRAPLVAKKGDRHVHHFAHHHEEGCQGALETALHMYAKEVLHRRRRVVLPPVYLPHRDEPWIPARQVRFDQVWLEWRAARQIVPDLLVRTGRRWLLVEIAVTHPAGEEKIERIRAGGHAAVELDVTELVADLTRRGRPFDNHQFEQRLLCSAKHKRWLFNPRREALERQLRDLAAQRRVTHRQYGRRHAYTVRPCPQGKRRHQANLIQTWPYADVFQDCLHCPFCLEITYRQEYRGYHRVSTLPETVICWGEHPEWPDRQKNGDLPPEEM